MIKGTRTGRDVFNKLDHNVQKRGTEVGKTVFVCTGGGGALQGGRKGSKSLRAGDGSPRASLALHHPRGSAGPQVSRVSASPGSTNVVRNCEFHQNPPRAMLTPCHREALPSHSEVRRLSAGSALTRLTEPHGEVCIFLSDLSPRHQID